MPATFENRTDAANRTKPEYAGEQVRLVVGSGYDPLTVSFEQNRPGPQKTDRVRAA